MSYLVCDKCGGYYELQSGESPNDFDARCECGGTLKYVQDLNDVDDSQKLCPSCGKENVKSSKKCVFCGETLKGYKNHKKIKWSYVKYGVFISSLITLSGSLTLQHVTLNHDIGFIMTVISLILSPFIGAFIASYSSNTYKNGLLNGLLSIFLITILILFYDVIFLKPQPLDFYSIEPMFFLMFGPIGSLIGVFVKKNILQPSVEPVLQPHVDPEDAEESIFSTLHFKVMIMVVAFYIFLQILGKIVIDYIKAGYIGPTTGLYIPFLFVIIGVTFLLFLFIYILKNYKK